MGVQCWLLQHFCLCPTGVRHMLPAQGPPNSQDCCIKPKQVFVLGLVPNVCIQADSLCSPLLRSSLLTWLVPASLPLFPPLLTPLELISLHYDQHSSPSFHKFKSITFPLTYPRPFCCALSQIGRALKRGWGSGGVREGPGSCRGCWGCRSLACTRRGWTPSRSATGGPTPGITMYLLANYGLKRHARKADSCDDAITSVSITATHTRQS
jgi:hypothetical protein